MRASLLARAAPRPLTGVAGALALATEPPREQLMLRKPYGRTEAIINNVMWRNLLAMAAFQLIVLFTLYYRGCDLLHFGTSQQIHSASLCANYPSVPYLAPGAANGTVTCYDRLHGCPPLKDVNGAKFSSDDRLKFSDYNTLTTTIFNAFVFMQFFNEMNARNMEEANVFRGLFGALPSAVASRRCICAHARAAGNHVFVGVLLFTSGAQFCIVQFAGTFAQTVALNWQHWVISVIIGICTLPIALLVKQVAVPETPSLPEMLLPRWFFKPRIGAGAEPADVEMAPIHQEAE